MFPMNDGGREVASEGRGGVSVDPDAPWRRGGTSLAEREPEPLPSSADRSPFSAVQLRRDDDETVDDAASPWSRQAIEAPLPTIDQIRSRWRRELGLEAPEVARPAENAPAIVRRADDVPRSTVSGDLILVGLLVAFVVAGSLAVAWALVPETLPEQVATATLPADAAEVWTVDLGADALVALGDGMVVAATAASVDAYSSDDGTPLWSHRYDADGRPVGVAVYDDVAIVVQATSRTVVTLTGLGADGSVVWSRPGPFSSIDLLPDRPVEYSRPAAVTRIGVLDPATGDAIGREVEGVELTPPDHYVIGRRDGELSVFDLRAGRWLAPSISEFGLRSLAPVDEYLLGLTESSDIIVYDQNRVALDQRAFVSDAFGDFNGRAELVGGVPGTGIGIVASGSSVGFDTSDGSIDVVWEVPGRVGTPVETRIGPVSVARVVDGRSGEVNHALVDVTDGRTLVVTDEGATREAPPTVAADGYVVAPAVGDLSRTISAHDFDGGQRWSLALEPGDDFRLVDGTLFVIGAGGTIAAHR